MQRRFKNFKLNWPKVNIKNLQSIRNNLEHFHASEPEDQIQEVIAECFPMVESFFETLNKDPAEELEDAWKIMLEEKNFYNVKKEECNITFKGIKFPEMKTIFDIACPECSSNLLFQEDENNTDPASMKIRCKACGEGFSAETFIALLVECEFGADNYISYKDAGIGSIHHCPDCGEETYVSTGNVNECYLCSCSIYGECARCGNSLSIENLSVNNSSYCDYCDYVMSKAD